MEADTDEKFVTQLAHRHDLELHVSSSNVAAHARSQHLSLEAAARQLRYQYFRQMLEEEQLNRIATGHTLDDQAETVLLRIIRGAGTRGLAGVYPQLLVDGSQFSVIRPLLQTRRKLLETYREKSVRIGAEIPATVIFATRATGCATESCPGWSAP